MLEGIGPMEKSSVYIDGEQEALRYKWIESEKAGHDLGEWAIRCWVRQHWNGFLREKWLEHLEGRTFWIELDHDDFGLLQRSFRDSPLIGEILGRLKAGQENLDILNWAIDAVRKGGTVSVMDAYGPMFSAVKFGDALNKGLTLNMNQCPVKRQWPRLFEHVRNGHLTPRDLVTHRFPLEHIAEAYHVMSAKLDGCIKPLIVPGASS